VRKYSLDSSFCFIPHILTSIQNRGVHCFETAPFCWASLTVDLCLRYESRG